MNAKITFSTVVAVALMSGAALADWYPGDPYKMHWPQLPDPNGWDVSFTETSLGDDWLCTETGPVSDIHLWVSFRGDVVPSPEGVVSGYVQIWNDVPPDGTGFSHPGEPLWGMTFDTRMPNVRMRLYGEGEQGWYGLPYEAVRPDHNLFYQINIDPVGVPDGIPPFTQREGDVYWLVAQLSVFDPASPTLVEIGWKTALPSLQFRDDAVYSTFLQPGWLPLEDPFTGQSLDLAFVITPEPTTLALLGIGGLMMLRRGCGQVLRRRVVA